MGTNFIDSFCMDSLMCMMCMMHVMCSRMFRISHGRSFLLL